MIFKNLVSSSRLWLFFGVLFFVAVVFRGMIADFTIYDIPDTFYAFFDWCAAAIIYFFLGAMVGHLFDWYFNRKVKHPLWFFLIVGLWIVSIFLSFVFVSDAFNNFFLYLFFPFTFGIFLPAVAYNLFFTDLMIKFVMTKLLLNLVFLSVFVLWVYSFIKNLRFERVLLLLIFLVLTSGMVGCVFSL